MKKRAMKKWVPKRTGYCGRCRLRRYITTVKIHRDINCEHADDCNEDCWTKPDNSCRDVVYRCEYLNYTDWKQDSLLWDGCKECGVSDKSTDEYYYEKYRMYET